MDFAGKSSANLLEGESFDLSPKLHTTPLPIDHARRSDFFATLEGAEVAIAAVMQLEGPASRENDASSG